MKASIIIPTKNPGLQFENVLRTVLEQEVSWEFEVFVIDSGSSDGTVALCQSFEKVRLKQIAAEEFGHGRTRNLGVTLTSGEFAVFLTHDALPSGKNWLAELISAADKDPAIAGAFGRHIAYPHDGPFLARDLNHHFDGFLEWPSVVRLEDPARYKVDPSYRQFLHFFSNNNSCVRRSVWEKIPYPEVDFAEDQIWAQKIIEAGYSKAYANNAVVFHSHGFNFVESCRRSFDESRAMKMIFGYNLCPSLFHMLAQSFKTTKADYIYGFTEKIFSKNIKWLFHCPMNNAFKQLGYYLGQRYKLLPSGVANFISRDKSISSQ